ncbi:hypothetical protein AB832_03015 [Flavobacteriaceae bacterium (ex Bugula neritina AB1)]|nr:hypothetical protein AB832_03015 [Flavobacteriaceae bacterium (ex Bugula neritina AB1)]
MEIAGYQSDFTLDNVSGDSNLPQENNLGGYAITTGADDNVYELSLDPPLTKPYKAGLSVEVVFHNGNTDSATLNIDNQGAIIDIFNGRRFKNKASI